METVKVKTAEEILKDHLHGIHFINSDETFDRVISAMTEFASIQTSELKAEIGKLKGDKTLLEFDFHELDEKYKALVKYVNERKL